MSFYIFVVCKGTGRDITFVEVTIREVCYVLILMADMQQLLMAMKSFKPDGFLLEEDIEVAHGISLAAYLAGKGGFEHVPVVTFEDVRRTVEQEVSVDVEEVAYIYFPDKEILFKIVDVLFFCMSRYSVPAFSVFSFQ
jgi:hypothetical protein